MKATGTLYRYLSRPCLRQYSSLHTPASTSGPPPPLDLHQPFITTSIPPHPQFRYATHANLIHSHTRLVHLITQLVALLNQSDSIRTSNSALHLSDLIVDYKNHLDFLKHYKLHPSSPTSFPYNSSSSTSDPDTFFHHVSAHNSHLIASFDHAWTPLVGTVIMDPRLLNSLIAILTQFHSITLGISYSLAKVTSSSATTTTTGPELHLSSKTIPTDPYLLVQDAIEKAKLWADSSYQNTPPSPFILTNHTPETSFPIFPALVPKYMHGILVSSLCAAISSCSTKLTAKLASPPSSIPIHVFIVNGTEDICFRISHRGLGLSQRQLAQVFNFGLIAAAATPRDPALPFQIDAHPLLTPDTPISAWQLKFLRVLAPTRPIHSWLIKSARVLICSLRGGDGVCSVFTRWFKKPELHGSVQESMPVLQASRSLTNSSPPPAVCLLLQQHAVSLSLARVHARYFGGDLDIHSMECYGADTYLHFSIKNNNK